MTMLLDGRLRDLATQTHLLEEKVSSLGWMAVSDSQTLKSMTRAQAHLMLAECDLLDALEANEKKEKKTMSSEKPFWEGKTLMEIQNLDKRVKVTMENGDVFIGKLVRRSRDTDGICSLSMQLDAHRTYLHVFSAESSDTQPIIPSYVDTVELLDDPNYERIEEADDLQEKDIAVMLDGNRYKVTDVEKGRNRFWGRVYGAVGPECIALGFNAFTYGLRPKPRLPDKPGLWLDKDDNTWVMGENAFPLTCIDAGNWSITRPQFSTDSVQVLNAAPFRLAKAVEA